MTPRDTATVCAISAVVGALVAALFLVPPAVVIGLFFACILAVVACVFGWAAAEIYRHFGDVK